MVIVTKTATKNSARRKIRPRYNFSWKCACSFHDTTVVVFSCHASLPSSPTLSMVGQLTSDRHTWIHVCWQLIIAFIIKTGSTPHLPKLSHKDYAGAFLWLHSPHHISQKEYNHLQVVLHQNDDGSLTYSCHAMTPHKLSINIWQLNKSVRLEK